MGLQLIGRPGADADVLLVAAAWEAVAPDVLAVRPPGAGERPSDGQPSPGRGASIAASSRLTTLPAALRGSVPTIAIFLGARTPRRSRA